MSPPKHKTIPGYFGLTIWLVHKSIVDSIVDLSLALAILLSYLFKPFTSSGLTTSPQCKSDRNNVGTPGAPCAGELFLSHLGGLAVRLCNLNTVFLICSAVILSKANSFTCFFKSDICISYKIFCSIKAASVSGAFTVGTIPSRSAASSLPIKVVLGIPKVLAASALLPLATTKALIASRFLFSIPI